MRIDTTTTGIHDLTVAEATSLRALCEGMLRGPVSLDHPLFVRWATECVPHRSSDLTMLTIAFLPRALHALLVHAESDRCLAVASRSALVRGATCQRKKGHRGFHENSQAVWAED